MTLHAVLQTSHANKKKVGVFHNIIQSPEHVFTCIIVQEIVRKTNRGICRNVNIFIIKKED